MKRGEQMARSSCVKNLRFSYPLASFPLRQRARREKKTGKDRQNGVSEEQQEVRGQPRQEQRGERGRRQRGNHVSTKSVWLDRQI